MKKFSLRAIKVRCALFKQLATGNSQSIRLHIAQSDFIVSNLIVQVVCARAVQMGSGFSLTLALTLCCIAPTLSRLHALLHVEGKILTY